MKKLILVALTALLVMPAMAQTSTTPPVKKEKQKTTPEQRAERVTNKLQTDLQLSPEQKTKIHTVNLSYYRKLNDIKGKYTDSKSEGAKSERKAARKELDSNYKTILTAAQYNQLKEEIKSRKKKSKVNKK